MRAGPIRLAGPAAITIASHLVLPDGKIATASETKWGATEVDSAADEKKGAVQHGARRERQSVERKPHR